MSRSVVRDIRHPYFNSTFKNVGHYSLTPTPSEKRQVTNNKRQKLTVDSYVDINFFKSGVFY